ncbi:tRNA pseudouridine(38-40) synthase TruA [Apilactobacillus sp. TMW 2.2459]|uniref:tRNA pseudouridine(38-40) synthase TruA n=1 Tax=Apilactobacillus xinyiensis TaxID=2841032 RepID=UPI00200D1E01|nr:tRNA pseudouridine(38-40) synthase TruA [Apilactobacillus xinyiensis]
MLRYKVTVAYDGTNFAGFQKQPNQRTVEGTLTKAVNKMAHSSDIEVFGSGRTDSGVHALGQVVHFDFPFNLNEINMFKALNSLMPLDVEIIKVEKVSDDFHARYDVSGKKYVYKVYLGEFINPFKRFYTAHWRFPIEMDNIKVALNDLVGEHDFTSFVASGSTAKSNVRTIYNATCSYNKDKNELEFEFYGNGFLYNMVRIMVGVLLEIGSNYRDKHDILRLYKVKDRDQARRTAAACGLYLKKVYYKGEDPEHPTKLPYR